MFLNSFFFLSIAIFSASSAFAVEWPKPAVDAAVAIVRNAEKGMAECVEGAHAKIAFDVVQKDINGDGVNELEISSHVEQLGTGAITCFGGAGQDIYLMIPNGKGGWQTEFGYDAASLEYQSRGKGLFPDVEITGPGFCFPIWRYFHGRYAIWKTCDGDNKLVYAYTIKNLGATNVVPRDPDDMRPENALPLIQTTNSALNSAQKAVGLPVIASASDWSGDYALDCKNSKLQCMATFKRLPDNKVSGEFVVADRMDINKVRCAVIGVFANAGSGIKADTKGGTIYVSRGTEGLNVRGFLKSACSVSLNGTYMDFSDE